MGNTYFKRSLPVPSDSFFLFGPRGTGKSSWIADNFKTPGLAIDLLDEEEFLAYASDPGLLGRRLESLPPKAWVVIDEVQRLPSLLNTVHRGIEKQKLRFVLSGSSARKLRKKGVNLLGGRAIECQMHPFTPFELGGDFSLEDQLQFGSLPVAFRSEERKRRLLSYVQTYLSQEIQRESAVKRLPSFVRFLSVAALCHGQTLNLSNLARDTGVARSTVQGYLEILEDSLMVFYVDAFRPKLRVKEVAHPKFYWFDSGVLRAVKRNLSPVIAEERGALFEGWVAQTLRAQQAYRETFDDLTYWSTHDGGPRVEVDFLLRRGSEFVAIEAKSSDRFRPEFIQGLRAIGDLKGVKQRVLVYGGQETLKPEAGIQVLPVPRFLKWLENL